MLTINWWRMLGCLTNDKTKTGLSHSVNIRNAEGYGYNFEYPPADALTFGYDAHPCPYLGRVITNLNVAGARGVAFGTGTTPATLKDYYLSGDLISTISVTCEVIPDPDFSYGQIKAVYNITNTGSSDVTIGEVAAFAQRGQSSWTGKHTLVMMERTVLETPLTIHPGETRTLTYTIRFDFPG